MAKLGTQIQFTAVDDIAHGLGPEERNPQLLLCFSHLRWNFVWQRPQHLMTRAAKYYDVIFWEEPVRGDGEPHLREERPAKSITVLTPVLPHGLSAERATAEQSRLLDAVLLQRPHRQLTCWYYTPMAVPFSRHLAADLCVYDCMDELSAFRDAPPGMLVAEQELFDRADMVFTGGRSLYEAKRHRHTDVHAFPSSIDKAHFGKARNLNGAGLDQSSLPRPRIGFCGVIDERMDLDLLAGLANAEPGWQFVMIGPVVKIDPATLPRPTNIHWLGMRSYEELPAYIAGWDVALMPFALNESTRFISPTKTPEFLAAGIPVVSTAIPDVVQPYGEARLVGIAWDASAMRKQISAAMRRPRKAWLTEVDRFLAGMSWDKTFADMHALMMGRTQFAVAGLTAAAAQELRHV